MLTVLIKKRTRITLIVLTLLNKGGIYIFIAVYGACLINAYEARVAVLAPCLNLYKVYAIERRHGLSVALQEELICIVFITRVKFMAAIRLELI